MHVNVGNIFSFMNLELTLKQFGKSIKPTVEKRESRNPISYMMNGFREIRSVTQTVIATALDISLPRNRIKKYTVLIVEALTKEDENPANIVNIQMMVILRSSVLLPLDCPTNLSTPTAKREIL